MPTTLEQLQLLLNERILVIDGAMGTMIQRHKLSEQDFRGERFREHPHDLKGNNDLLVLTQPDIIRTIHRDFLAAGADVISTDTFNANAISQTDYHLENLAYELNVAAAKLAREVADEVTNANPNKPRFVAGSMGPANKSLSISPDVNNPGFRATTFDEVKATYYEQVRGLIDGGADILLVETIFDTLNGKAAMFAIQEYCQQHGVTVPTMVSGTIVDASGRTLSGQTAGVLGIDVTHAEYADGWPELLARSGANWAICAGAFSCRHRAGQSLPQRWVAE